LEAVRHEQEARKEPPHYNGRCLRLTDADRAIFEAEGRRPAIRFAVPRETVRFNDLVRGEVEFESHALGGDRVIIRSDGTPLYHFTVVIDDAAMQISNVLRGEDHLSNTPLHILLFRALGYPEPMFGHIPLILNPDRSKMSKRKSQTSITAYREQGYLPEAMVNFLAFLGWSPGTEEEIFTLAELAERFDIGHVHKAGAVFDKDRLDFMNGTYIRGLPDAQLALRLRPFMPDALDDQTVHRLVPLLKERLVRLSDTKELVSFLVETDREVAARYSPEELTSKKADAAATARALVRARSELEALDDGDFAADVLESRLRAAAGEIGWKAGDFFRPIRLAVTGRAVTPPLFGSMELLGRERCLARLDAALEALATLPGVGVGA